MSAATPVDEESVPRFRPHMKLTFDRKRERWTILAPERLFLPDETALEILRRCDGTATIRAIADDLATRYDAPADVILADVMTLVRDFTEKGVLEA